ncbi:class I SAM-dependent methyltransferase [Gloeocapsa sp. PCC 73106]|uniref:class I SAM-dependent methyltransferase n=1 Tax=Gloeocapsa sp. PCC 73106 TaxID=102232 RepID=UPI0002ACD5FB|nr:class I SAM-dependent methyltransferase [Gloeocapsa sp. PCC 73106]ELS00134.1 hypothetical protein GLO73106DRAFT_00039890 [Gloeocapsa sp. PCC 73106]
MSSLQQVIKNSGYLNFADYLNLVLYHPQYGYYSAKNNPIGAQGDFFTSSSLGADFGELLGVQFEQMWQILGCPHPFILLEMGAGTGDLAQDLLNYVEREYPDFFSAIAYLIIEASPQLKAQQQKLLTDKLNKVNWIDWEQIPDNSLIGCCFSNELVDAFPVHQVILQQGQLREVYVTWQENQLIEVYQELSSLEIENYFKLCQVDFPSSIYPEGYRTEVNLQALHWLKTLASKLQTGYILTIDYGYDAQRYYHPQRAQGTLQCYYQHHRHNNPYLYLGEQDITSQVNFTSLERQGELLGLDHLGFTKQGLFLMALGVGDRFQALHQSQAHLQEILQRRDALHQLINPSGLGNFGVLLQAKGLTPPQKLQPIKGFTMG